MNGLISTDLIFCIHTGYFSISRFALTTVPSPCINWCDINPENGYCRGCYRTLAEIADWSELSDPKKLRICEQLAARKPKQAQ
jgi:predicted Fe-S protein YdhL (DUF1289 family)